MWQLWHILISISSSTSNYLYKFMMNCQTKFTLFFEDWCFSNQGPLKLLYIHWLKLEKLSLQTLPVPWTTVDALLVPPGICCSHTAVIPMALGRWTSMLPSEDNGGAWRNCSSSASLVPAASVSWVIEVFRPTATLPLGKSQKLRSWQEPAFPPCSAQWVHLLYFWSRLLQI